MADSTTGSGEKPDKPGTSATPTSGEKPVQEENVTAEKSLGSQSLRYRPGRHKPVFDTALWIESCIFGSAQESSDQALLPKVTGIDLQDEANRKSHHTDQYDNSGLIVRRGDDFDIVLQLDKPYDPKTDQIKLVFTIGERPQVSRGTLIRVGPGEPKNAGRWGWIFQDSNPDPSGCKSLALHVTPAADCVVGRYELYVQTSRTDETGKKHKQRYKHPEQITILFNPWCKDDRVYMKYEARRKEFVLNETGRIYNGTFKKLSFKPWNFGQFEKISLEAALFLLDHSGLEKHVQGNPTLVTRALTAMANSNNEGGVLSGNWSGKYEGGTAPSAWNGSVAILEQFMQRKQSVNFGQCWVFAGLLNTLCRTLGIPARCVTNFKSAHDKDFSMTIDHHITSGGVPLKWLDDSVWNFHVWNEAWFTRPDLPDGYNGWQVIDATPQEASEGIMQCGPSPVAAVKEGQVYLGYDTKFVFAEVNGDVIKWVLQEDGEFAIADVQHHAVGRLITTKATFSDKCVDITTDYKYLENSEEERISVQRASFHSSRKQFLEPIYTAVHDVKFNWEAIMETNGDVKLTLHLRNSSTEARHVDIKVHALAAYYTGVTGEILKSFSQDDLLLEPGKDKTLTWSMEAKDIFNTIDEDASLGAYILAKVKETNQLFANVDTLVLDKPDLEFLIPEGAEIKRGQPLEVTVKFTNPLAVALTGVVIHMEGPGLQNTLEIPFYGATKTGEAVTKTVTLTPRLPGRRELIACLNSRQLTGITGVIALDVNV
jgi:transglutaminase 1